MYTLLDESSVTPIGRYNAADDAALPSPLKLEAPVPAIVVIISGPEVGLIDGTRDGCVLGDTVGVILGHYIMNKHHMMNEI